MKNELKKTGSHNSAPVRKSQKKWIKWFWLCALIFIAFILPSLFIKNAGKEITWQQFKKEVLSKGAVEKIIVVNNERADIYIKKEFTDDPQFKDVFQNSFTEKINPAPQYFIKIFSTEFFERRLFDTQKNISLPQRIGVTYSKEHDWIWYMLIWILRIFTLLVLWDLFISKIYFK
jgi:AFG3 family protein